MGREGKRGEEREEREGREGNCAAVNFPLKNLRKPMESSNLD